MKKLEFYFFPECPYCQIVQSAIEATKLDKSITFLNIRQDPANREKLLALTGRGTVPCLVIDNKPMHESRDIASWLHQYAKDISNK